MPSRNHLGAKDIMLEIQRIRVTENVEHKSIITDYTKLIIFAGHEFQNA